MFAIISNGLIALLVPAGTPFTWDGIQYPANWCNLSSPEEKAAIGMVDVVYGQYPNDTYYWVSQDAPVYKDGVVTIGYTATPKDLFECQMQAVNAVQAQAFSILSPSDWRVVKGYETKSVIPPAWNTWRQDIRTQCDAQVIAIEATKTVDELAALPAVEWAHDPNYVA
tara:strand:- start:5876 stop:6379 length:504 start_codon:yes stop_codon:yes gene_type:complete